MWRITKQNPCVASRSRQTGSSKQPDIVIVDKQKKEAVVIDIAVPSDNNIKKKKMNE